MSKKPKTKPLHKMTGEELQAEIARQMSEPHKFKIDVKRDGNCEFESDATQLQIAYSVARIIQDNPDVGIALRMAIEFAEPKDKSNQ